jgi:hypothetical protein
VGINLWSTSSLLATPAALVWRTCTTSALYSAAYGRKDAHHFTCSAHTGALVSVCCVYTLQGQHTHEAYTGDRTKEAFETFADSLVPTAGQPEVKHVDLKSAPRASGCNVAGAHMAQPHCLRCRLSGTAADVVHGRLKVFVQPCTTVFSAACVSALVIWLPLQLHQPFCPVLPHAAGGDRFNHRHNCSNRTQ